MELRNNALQKLRGLFFASGVMVISSCTPHKDDPKVHFSDLRMREQDVSAFSSVLQVRALESCDPEKDASVAYASGDFRLVGVGGICTDIPGVDLQIEGNKIKVKVITGTHDQLSGTNSLKIMAMSRPYARKYNRRMLELLTSGGRDDTN